MRRVRVLSFSGALLLTSLLTVSSFAQEAAPSPNQPSGATMTGAPPYSTHDSIREDVALATGGLHVSIPVLSLQGRGGQTFNLNWVHDSHGITLQEFDQSNGWNYNLGGIGLGQLNPFDYATWIVSPDTLGFFTVPHLRVSFLFLGDYCQTTGQEQACTNWPLFCNSNFVFRDESGTSYTFAHSNQGYLPLATNCSYTPNGVGGQDIHTNPVGNSDQSNSIKLDSSNPNDIIVWLKDGTAIHFPAFTSGQQYFISNPTDTSSGPEQLQYYYDNDFVKIVDPNGNTIINSGGTITDSAGHTITVVNSQSFGGGSVTWTDSNGKSQSIAATPGGTAGPAVSTNNTSCQFNNPYQASNQTQGYLWNGDLANVGNYATGMNLSFPGGATYSFQIDQLGKIVKINYPAGGYTRYDYQDSDPEFHLAYLTCSAADYWEVSAKHVCSSASGSCSQSTEVTTTYTPTNSPIDGNNVATNVVDPLGSLTYYVFGETTEGGNPPIASNPRETARYIYQGQSTLIKTIQTAWTGTADNALPNKVTTTLNDVTPNLVSYVTITYDSSPGTSGDNPQEVDEYDFTGTLVRKTNYVWQTGGNYTVTVGHLLDRPLSETVTDPLSGNVSTISYLDDAIGNVKTTTVGGTGATSLATSYQRNSYGDATSVTDPALNVTSYCYDGSATCPNSSTADLYGLPTAVTDPLGYTSLFSYYPTTSLLNSKTDPNKEATTYTYDALGRVLTVNYPDNTTSTKSITNTYVDTAPQSVQTAVAISSGSAKTTVSLLDGLGREYQSQLTSDPTGTDLRDTTYDPLERVASVSTPYRKTTDATYGVTGYVYDALGRTCVVVRPDGTAVSGSNCPTTAPKGDVFTTYAGNATTVTDEAGNPRLSTTDALGRLIEVEEPTLALISPATAATGSYTITGTEQSIQTASATSGTGSVTFTGSEKSQQTSATAGTGSVSIAGVTCSGINGGGYMTITVGGYTTSQASYTCSVSAASLATTLANSLNQSTVVSASATSNGANSGTITITAKTTGSNTDYSLSVVNSTSGQNLGYSITPSGSTLTGGQNGQTTWDSGVFYVTVNGHQTPYSWTGTSSTNPSSANLATGMASAINQDASAFVNASAAGSAVSLTARATGATTDYALSVSSYDNTNLNSFSISDSGSALTGGTNAQYNYDAGTVSLTVGSTNVSVNYGSTSTENSVATALASALAGSAVTATVPTGTGTINVQTTQTGSSTNLAISASSKTTNSSFSTPSFTAGTSGSTLTGGTNAVYGSTLGTPLVTQYSYDAFGNLTCAVQKGTDTTAFTTCAAASANWRPRSFSYDGMSRLLTAQNPESGTINYSYLASGGKFCAGSASALCLKTAPAPNQTGTATVATTYTYDALNRLTGKSYNDGSTLPVKYGYDGVALTGCTTTPPPDTDKNPIGYRTSMCDGSGATSWTHDAVGRVLQERRAIGGVTGEYDNDAYYLDGSIQNVTSLGQGVSYTYNKAGRLVSAIGGGINYATGATYAAPGELLTLSVGTGITITNAYNNRLQPTTLSAAVGSSTIFGRTFNFNWGNGDNGNVFQIVNTLSSARNQTFLYDPLNRIQQATSSGPAWGEVYSIDNWGNITNRTGVSGQNNYEPFPASATVNTKNQLISPNMSYDAAGNMISDAGYTYVYDAENRLTSTAGYTYVYDGDGKRVEKCLGSSCAGSTSGQMYWYGTGSAASAETDLSGNLLHHYIFFNRQRIARYDTSDSTTHYYFSDQLGSHDVVTSSTGSCEQDIDFYPYGGAENDYCPVRAQNYKFTGKERDTESGLDQFGARYYGSSLGRFMTPDWAPSPTAVPYAHYGNPQSLNLYAYVENNPTTTGDPDGHSDAGTFCSAACRARAAQYAAAHPVTATLEPIGWFGSIPLATIGGEAAVGSVFLRNLIGVATAYFGTPTGQNTINTLAGAIAPPGTPMQAFGLGNITGEVEGFSIGRLGNGAEVAARITTTGENTTVSVLGAFNEGGTQEVSGTLKAIESGAQAAAAQAGSETLTLQAVAVINPKLAKLLTRSGFTETTVQVGEESVKALQKTFKVCTGRSTCAQ